jgi:glycosyltransferase involved in cell wall biosynthesis
MPEWPVPASRTPPQLSVVMPVHNGEDYLEECLDSIVRQTFRDFEFVILDDASTDRTAGILRDWTRRDDRIRVVTSPHSLGVVGSANRVVREARATICARMDADDVSHPDRLRRQWEVLQASPDVCLVGTLAEAIDARGRLVRPRDRSALLRGGTSPPFPHGSAMFRHETFDEVGGYREACRFWEDRDLFIRMARRARVLVLPLALYRLRCHQESVRLATPYPEVREAYHLMYRCLALYRAGQDYTPLLEHEHAEVGVHAAAELSWLSSLGSLRLWAGNRPGILKQIRALRGIRLQVSSLHVLGLATLGEFSPGLYRGLSKWAYRIRDWKASARVAEWRPVEWQFP